MKVLRLLVLTACVFAATTLSAAHLYVACDLENINGYGVYSGLTYIEFEDDDPYWEYIAVSYTVTGDNYEREDDSKWFNRWTYPYIEGSFDFPLDSHGGCDTPQIYAQSASNKHEDAFSTGHQMCWQQWICQLTVNIDSGGYITPGGPSGDYECYDCITLSAFALDGYEFVGWSGDVTSSSPVVTVCMGGQDRSVTAVFSPIPPPPPDPTDCGTADWVSGCSPVVVNFEKGDYKLTGAEAPVLFDMSGSGHRVLIGWTAAGADEAFLYLDRDHDGMVTNGTELFGNATPLSNGAAAGNGFVALAQFDANHDGVIDERDAIWAELALWRDLNHDGISQPNETSSLAGSAVTGIDLDYHWTARRDAAGNVFRYQSKVWIDRIPRPLYDIYFVRVP